MARYMCSNCHEVVETAATRYAFCNACGTPLTTEELLPVQAFSADREQPVSLPEAAGS
jgi:predicted amidophosphoribosyltransferase